MESFVWDTGRYQLSNQHLGLRVFSSMTLSKKVVSKKGGSH